jgi:hypothetical protein
LENRNSLARLRDYVVSIWISTTGLCLAHLEENFLVLLMRLRIDLLGEANDGLELGVVGLLLRCDVEGARDRSKGGLMAKFGSAYGVSSGEEKHDRQ